MSNRENRCRHRARAPQALFACPTVSIRKFNSRNSSVARDEVGVERKFLQFSRWQEGGGEWEGGAKATDLKNLFSSTCRWRQGSILPASEDILSRVEWKIAIGKSSGDHPDVREFLQRRRRRRRHESVIFTTSALLPWMYECIRQWRIYVVIKWRYHEDINEWIEFFCPTELSVNYRKCTKRNGSLAYFWLVQNTLLPII